MITNNQQVFNKVVKHLLTQNSKSINRDGDCQYRGQDKTKCAIGCLISNQFYDSGLEGLGIDDASVMLMVKQSLEFSPDEGLLIDLQNIHDTSPVSKWRSELKALAKKYNLKFPKTYCYGKV